MWLVNRKGVDGVQIRTNCTNINVLYFFRQFWLAIFNCYIQKYHFLTRKREGMRERMKEAYLTEGESSTEAKHLFSDKQAGVS